MPVKDSIGIDWAIGGSEVKTSACNAGNLGLIPGLGGSPGEGNGNPFWYSCLGNPIDREASEASPWGCKRVQLNLAAKQLWYLAVYEAHNLRPFSGVVES